MNDVISSLTSCTVFFIAPDSSNCPPGSKLILAFSFSRPMMFDFSNIGTHSNLFINKSNTVAIDLGPS